MRDIFLPKLPGLYKHSFLIEKLTEANLPKLSRHFQTHNIKAEMYASEWIFGMFSSVISLDQMHVFFDSFFANKWVFFYQLVLQILKLHEDDLLQEEDLYCILHLIKNKTGLTQQELEHLEEEQKNVYKFEDDSVYSLPKEERGMLSLIKSWVPLLRKTTAISWSQLIYQCQRDWADLHTKQRQQIVFLLTHFDY